MKKKIIIMAVFVFFVNSLCLATSYDINFNNQKQLIDPSIAEDIEKHNAQRAKEFKYQDTNDGRDISPLWTYPISKTLSSFPLYQQEAGNWCGPASIQMMIGFNGKFVSQSVLASQSGIHPNGSNTLNLRNTLNHHVGTIHNFGVIRIGSSGAANLFNIINSNIFTKNQPVLALVRTQELSYYHGHPSNHYIVIKGMTKYIDDGTGQPVISLSQINIADPNNNSQYFGEHIEGFNQVYDAVSFPWEQAYNIAY